LVAKSPGGVQIRASALLSGGIVGYRIPHALATHQVSIAPGDLLVIATDGILERPRSGHRLRCTRQWRSPNTSSTPTAGNPTTRWCSPPVTAAFRHDRPKTTASEDRSE
jgi:hypothetical protein